MSLLLALAPWVCSRCFSLGLPGSRRSWSIFSTEPGGQCAELYPEKPIYDIPSVPICTGQELTDRLLEQIKPFEPVFHFGEMAAALDKTEDGRWQLTTDTGRIITAPVLVIAAGGGSFVPKRPPIPGIEAYEATRSVLYAVRRVEDLRDKVLVIAGGGDSALDWTINLAPCAKSLTLVHRRHEFRAAPDTVRKMRELESQGLVRFELGQPAALKGSDGILERRRAQARRRLDRRDSRRDAAAFLRAHHEARADRAVSASISTRT